jgi:uncharacterized LabA/DUF88 family protein
LRLTPPTPSGVGCEADLRVGLCFFRPIPMPPLRTNVYIDGFNFYYGCVRGTACKWLDFRALCSQLLDPARNSIQEIKYFTARVDGRGDPHRPTRQDAFLRAIQAHDPDLRVILGHFLTNETYLPKADGTGSVRVLRTEEKGSDVNLATHLLWDAFAGRIDCAVLITNDSDLVEPVRIVRRELHLLVGVIFPVSNPGRRPSVALSKEASFVKQVRKSVLERSQLPDPVHSPTGDISKPAGW